MKRNFFISSAIALMALIAAPSAMAQVEITRVDAISPNDDVYMDMATEAAKSSKSQNGVAGGSVIILNNAFHSSGKGQTPEIDALNKARASSLENAVVYTINEPSTEAVVALSQRGVPTIYFVNPRADVIAAGIYPSSVYDDSRLPQDGKVAQLKQMNYAPAAKLIK